ncbi:MAG: MFS transporter [Candidatus Bathyarchaeia archaeon]
MAGSYLGMYPYDLGATIVEVGFLSSINYLSASIPAFVGGVLTHKYGRKRLLLYVWPSYVGFYLLTMIAPNWLFLIPAYLVYSIAYAGDPALSSIYADSLDENTRAEAVSILSTLSGISGLFMPPIGGLLIEYFGGIRNSNSLRVFYGLYTAFHALTIAYFYRYLEDDGICGASQNLRKALGSLKAIFEEGRMRNYLIFVILTSITSGLSLPFTTIYIFSEIGASSTSVGILTAISSGITYLTLNLGAWWSDRAGRKLPIILSFILSSSALTFLALADNPYSLFSYYLLVGLSAIGNAASTALLLEYVPSELRPQYFGVRETLMLLCLSISPPLGGFIYASIGAKALFLTHALIQGFIVIPFFLIAIPETRKLNP